MQKPAEVLALTAGQPVNPGIEQSPFTCAGKGEGSVPETGPGWWLSKVEKPALSSRILDGAVSTCTSPFLLTS